MSKVRAVFDNGDMWFPIVDLVQKMVEEKGKLHTSATSWLKRNIDVSGLKKLHVGGSTKKSGKLLCVNSDNIKIVGMYEAHILSNKDFRVKWSDLPDTPKLTSEAKLEVCWRNMYKWSKTEHISNTKITSKMLSSLRTLYLDLAERGDHPEQISYVEAIELLKK